MPEHRRTEPQSGLKVRSGLFGAARQVEQCDRETEMSDGEVRLQAQRFLELGDRVIQSSRRPRQGVAKVEMPLRDIRLKPHCLLELPYGIAGASRHVR